MGGGGFGGGWVSVDEAVLGVVAGANGRGVSIGDLYAVYAGAVSVGDVCHQKAIVVVCMQGLARGLLARMMAVEVAVPMKSLLLQQMMWL